MKRAGAWFLAITGFLACPCHLPVTLALAAGVLGGTSLGAFLLANPVVIYTVFTLYFVAGIYMAYRLLGVIGRKDILVKLIAPAEAKALKTGEKGGRDG